MITTKDVLVALMILTCWAGMVSGGQFYENPKAHYSIEFPEGWLIDRGTESSGGVSATAPKAAASLMLQANANGVKAKSPTEPGR